MTHVVPQTTEEFSRIVEACLIVSRRSKLGLQVVDSPELCRLADPSAPHVFKSGVYRTLLSGHDADGVIDEQFRFFRSHGLNFRWYVFPHSRPTDLAARLQRLGPAEVVEMHGLYAETESLIDTVLDGVAVEALCRTNLQEYVETMIAGWGWNAAVVETVTRDVHHDLERDHTVRKCFLARYQGSPAAVGSMRIINGVGYFDGGATRPEFRGKGTYRALIYHRIRQLREEGVPLAYALARASTSSPICRRLGFRLGCKSQTYEFA